MLVKGKAVFRVTPSSLTCGENGTVLPATLIFEREGRDAERYLVPIRMTSDLLGFKARPLRLNHVCRAERYRSS